VGDARIIAAMRENPLARSYRVDKMTLAALEATLSLYRDPPHALREIPVLAMLAEPVAVLRERAEQVRRALAAEGIRSDVMESISTVGAGAFPASELPSAAIALHGDAERWSMALRAGDTPVIGRTLDGMHRLDLRCIPEKDLPTLIALVRAAHG
jgi:L-seryl-tRNA(Ser) seleniumtransferase